MSRKPVILKDAPKHFSDFHEPPHVEADIRSWLGVPLIFGDHLIGMLSLDKQAAGFYTEEHARLAQAFAAQAASAIENAQLYDQLRDYTAQLEQRVHERTRELAGANKRLQELDRLKSKFVSDVSHELRTPVTNLSLYLDLLERGGVEKQAHYIGVLREQANRLKQLIEDILDLSRLDLATNVPLKLGEVDLNKIVTQVVRVHQLRVELAGLKIQFYPHVNPALILGERNQLSQVITNLIVNAINYTTKGQIDVRTFFDEAEQFVYLEIEDSGMGIPAEDLPHLFDRFYRGKHASQLTIPGNGLGLAIVQEIVIKHHGQIDVVSEVGKGSKFVVKFPYFERALSK